MSVVRENYMLTLERKIVHFFCVNLYLHASSSRFKLRTSLGLGGGT